MYQKLFKNKTYQVNVNVNLMEENLIQIKK